MIDEDHIILRDLIDLKDKIIKTNDDEKKDGRSNATRERIKDILIALDKIAVTSSLITKSKLGNTISSIKADYSKSVTGDEDKDKEIESIAKDLLLKWKSIMDKKKGQQEKKTEKKTIDKSVKVSATSRSSSPLSVSSNNNNNNNNSNNILLTLSDNRIKIVNAIKEIFKSSTNNESTLLNIATSIENAVHNLYPTDLKQYRNKIVSLNFNLKKNEKLRMQVLNGTITASVLVTLNAQELANDKLKEERHVLKVNESSAKRLDWNDEHHEEMMNELGLDSKLKWEYEEDEWSDPGD